MTVRLPQLLERMEDGAGRSLELNGESPALRRQATSPLD